MLEILVLPIRRAGNENIWDLTLTDITESNQSTYGIIINIKQIAQVSKFKCLGYNLSYISKQNISAF